MVKSGNITATLIILIVIAWIFSTLFSPYIIAGIRPNMQTSIGNPKAVYFYDIDSSCNSNKENNIVSALNYLSSATGVKFIQIPPPFAYIFGGIDYSCDGVRSGANAIGESESNMVGISYIIIVWNKIKLSDTGKETVLHETLHNIGFGHSTNANSIMYPVQRGNSQIDPDIIDFTRTFYVNNPFAYLTIFTVNMVVLPVLFFILLCGIAVIFEPIIKRRKRRKR